MKNVLKLLFLFLIGGCIYFGIEILFRGFSHWTMFILGGICFILIGQLNEHYSWDIPFWKQCLYGALIITSLEFLFGIVLNKILGLAIWDYSGLPFNVLGQICLPFSFIWFTLSSVAIILDDYIRYLFFNEDLPHYKLF